MKKFTKKTALAVVAAMGIAGATALPAAANYVTPSCHPTGAGVSGLGAHAVWWDNRHIYHTKNVYVYGTAWYDSWVSEKIGITDLNVYYPHTFWFAPPAHPAYFLLSSDPYRITYGWKLPIWFAPDWHKTCNIYIPRG